MNPTRISVALWLCILVVAGVVCAQPPASNSRRLIIVNASSTEDGDLAALYVSAAQVANTADWRRFSVPEDSALSRWLARDYNLTGTSIDRFPKTAAAMLSMLISVNKLPSEQLRRGDEILLPVLPAIPNLGAAQDLVQIPVGNKLYRSVPLSSLSNADYKSGHSSGVLQLAANVAFEDSAALRMALQRQSKLRVTRKLYGGPTDLLSIQLLGVPARSSGLSLPDQALKAQPSLDSDLAARAGAIPAEAAGYLYVLDFDIGSEKCSHGRMVLDVIKSRLNAYGAGHLFSTNVKPLELNFFGRPDETKVTLENILTTVIDLGFACHYRRLFAESHGLVLDSCDTPLSKLPVVAQTVREDSVSVPGYYIWLLYEFLLDASSKASVVSSSFFTHAGGFDIAGGSAVNKWPALVTAVLNPDRFPPARADELAIEQPTKSFFVRRLEFGTVLVGAVLRDGSMFGMTSSESPELSNAVTALQFGDGYGEYDPATGALMTCISAQDKGTSFATPALAVDLFLARALWRTAPGSPGALPIAANGVAFGQHPDPVPVLEAKRRLALAATVIPSLVGNAATAGVPELARLAAPVPRGSDVAVLRDGSVRQVNVTAARVRFDSFLQNYPQTFGAVQVRDGKVFVFDEFRRAWRLLESVEDFFVQVTQLSAEQSGQPVALQTVEFTSPEQFSSTYQSIARYK
jgi:hypothetical protein